MKERVKFYCTVFIAGIVLVSAHDFLKQYGFGFPIISGFTLTVVYFTAYELGARSTKSY